MIEQLLQFLEKVVIPLGPFGVFLASVLEEVIAPIPSALVMMMAGFLFVSGPVNFESILQLILYVALPAGLGIALGSLVVYGVAWWWGKAVLEKWGRFLGLYWSDVEKLQSRLSQGKKDELVIIGTRIIPFVPSVAISALCGFIRMNIVKYLWITFIGMFVRGMILGAIGWQAGNVYYKYAESVSRFENIGLLSVALITLVLVAVLFIKRKKAQ